MTYIFGDLGRSCSFFRDLGSKGKILLGSRGNYFQGSGEINALFSGIKGAQTTPGGPHFYFEHDYIRRSGETATMCKLRRSVADHHWGASLLL